MEDTPWTLVQGQVPGVLSRRRQVRHRCPRGRHWRNAFRTWANPRRDVFSPAAPMTGPIRARAVHQGSCDAKASVVRFATAQAAGGAVGDGRRSRGMSTNGATWAGATAGWRAVERVNRIEGARNTRAIALGLQTPRQWHDECRPSTCSASLPVPAAASPPRGRRIVAGVGWHRLAHGRRVHRTRMEYRHERTQHPGGGPQGDEKQGSEPASRGKHQTRYYAFATGPPAAESWPSLVSRSLAPHVGGHGRG